MREGHNKRIFAFITDRCANACKYCFVYDGKPVIEDMTREGFEKLCLEGKGKFGYLTFIGGEPLLHPDLYGLMEIALSHGYKISISTSGITKYGEQTDRIFSLPIDDVTVSLDSHDEKTNDTLRGKGSYRRALDTAKYLIERGIPVRFTATVCTYNKDHLPKLAELVRSIGAEQLDVHVMSKKGRAEGCDELELSPHEWLRIRRALDNTRFPAPFHISYPLMWYEGEELDEVCDYCDAEEGHRLSVMSNYDCYYCTISIGFDEMKVPLSQDPTEKGPTLYKKDGNLCLTERLIATNEEGLKYVCRFVKRRTGFTDN